MFWWYNSQSHKLQKDRCFWYPQHTDIERVSVLFTHSCNLFPIQTVLSLLFPTNFDIVAPYLVTYYCFVRDIIAWNRLAINFHNEVFVQLFNFSCKKLWSIFSSFYLFMLDMSACKKYGVFLVSNIITFNGIRLFSKSSPSRVPCCAWPVIHCWGIMMYHPLVSWGTDELCLVFLWWSVMYLIWSIYNWGRTYCLFW